jgi:archaellum component FlaC
MALIKNAINFGNGFNIGAVGPIDARMRVQYLSDLTSAWTDTIPSYIGMVVTVMYDENKPIKNEGSEEIIGYEPLGHVYVLKGSDATKSENWVKLSTAADSTVSADAVQANLDKAISANTSAHTVFSGAIQDNYSAITANTKSISDLNKSFEDEVKERQANDKYLSGVTSGIAASLAEYKIKNIQSTTPGAGGNSGHTILSLDENGILSDTIALDYNKTDKKIYLRGVGGTTIDEIDVTDFIKDGMLSSAVLKKEEGKPTKIVFSFNTDAGKNDIEIDVEEFLNADEVATLERSLEQHKGDTTLHFTTAEKTKLTNLYTKDDLDNKFNEISSALSANTGAHANLSSEIASAKTDISTVSGKVSTVSSQISTVSGQVSSVSGEVSTISSQISTVSGQVSSVSGQVSTVSGQVSSISGEVSTVKSNVSSISGDVKTISDKVSENEEVVAEALVNLQTNKVSSVTAEEQSNIVINEVKGENGISYTIGFQWLTF